MIMKMGTFRKYLLDYEDCFKVIFVSFYNGFEQSQSNNKSYKFLLENFTSLS